MYTINAAQSARLANYSPGGWHARCRRLGEPATLTPAALLDLAPGYRLATDALNAAIALARLEPEYPAEESAAIHVLAGPGGIAITVAWSDARPRTIVLPWPDLSYAERGIATRGLAAPLLSAWGLLSVLAEEAREHAARTRSHNAPAWRVAWRALALAASLPGLRAVATVEALAPLRAAALTGLPAVPSSSALASALEAEGWQAVVPLYDLDRPRQRRYASALTGCAIHRHPYYGLELIVTPAGDLITHSRARGARYAPHNGAPLLPSSSPPSPDRLSAELMIACYRLGGTLTADTFEEAAQ